MIQPGLDRIRLLLKDIQFPWKAIHVAGTNGKGSICGVASHLLTRRIIRNGRFTSPHLVHRWDCIEFNGRPVNPKQFCKVEDHFKRINESQGIGASEFEILTATAFQLFNDNKVDVGVVEVGMGGSLDATNILDNQVISVISKISRDHQNFLGSTLEEIARHKAGILRPGVPYIVNPINEWYVQEVIHTYAKQIGAGPCIIPDTPERRESLFKRQDWTKLAGKLRPFQRDNVVLGYLAFTTALESLGHSTIKASKLLPSLRSKVVLPGRMQLISCPTGIFGTPQKILVDGAHNADAASELSSFVQHKYKVEESPVTWILAMTQGKDAREYLRKILRPGDRVVTTSFGPVNGMPWVQPVDPAELKEIVLQVEPSVTAVHVPEPGPLRALCTAKYLSLRPPRIVLTGSLYLVGEFIRDNDLLRSDLNAFDMRNIDLQERSRVNHSIAGGAFTMNRRPTSSSDSTLPQDDSPQDDPESQRLLNEINKLERGVEKLKVEEDRLRRSELFSSESSRDENSTLPIIDTKDTPLSIGNNDLEQDMGTGSISRTVRGKRGPRIRYL